MKKNFSIRLISNDDIQKVTDWAKLEGFAPGFDDISIYKNTDKKGIWVCLLYTSPSPRDGLLSRMPSSA